VPYNSSLNSALRHLDVKPAEENTSQPASPITSAECSGMWMGRHYEILGRLGATGQSVNTSSPASANMTGARWIVAEIEAKFTSGDVLIAMAGSMDRDTAKQGKHLLSMASASLLQLLKNPSIISAAGGTFDTSFRFSVAGSFTDAKSALTAISAENDVTFTRETDY